MLAILWGLVVPARARALGRAGLRRVCLAALIGLVIEFAFGMILNLYVMIPPGEATASYIREIETAPGMLTAHAVLGLLLLAAAAIALLRAIALREVTLITPTVAGLAAVLSAFAAGEVFVKNSDSAASLSMAIATGVALACYIGLQSILSASASASRASVPAPRRPDRLRPTLDVDEAAS